MQSALAHPFVTPVIISWRAAAVSPFTVDLDNERGLVAVEVCDEGAEGVLAAELEAGDMVAAEA
jgi:hypothetical protein